MSYYLKNKTKIFSLNSNIKLATEISQYLNCSLGECKITSFSDGETQIYIQESVRGCEIYLIQSISHPVNENIMQLLIMIDAFKRASAKSINVVIPYYGYSRQDRKAKSREPITAKLIANLLQKSGATRILTVDLHAPQIQGFFDIPVDELNPISIFANHYLSKQLEDLIIIAPNNSGIPRARKLAEKLESPIAIIDKRTDSYTNEISFNIIGNVENKNAIIIDDLVDTGVTISSAAQILKQHSVKDIYGCCTHSILSNNALELIEDSPIKELVVTNSISQKVTNNSSKLYSLSLADLIAHAIYRINTQQSVSELFS